MSKSGRRKGYDQNFACSDNLRQKIWNNTEKSSKIGFDIYFCVFLN